MPPIRILSYYSGGGQKDGINEPLYYPITVKVARDDGTPVSGAQILWSVSGYPSGATGHFISPVSSVTSVDGYASTYVTLGDKSGTYTIKADCSTCFYGSPLQISATALSDNFSSKGATCNNAPLDAQLNLESGNLNESVHVLTIPGLEPQVDLSLTYNSVDSTSGTVGTGWTHSYAMSVTLEAGGYLTLKEEDGRRILFKESAPGNYFPLAEFGRPGAKIQKFTNNTYQLTRKDGTKYDFSSSGALSRITARNNNSLALGYSGSNLETITDNSNRVTRLGYEGSRLTSVTDPAGRITRIGYDPSGRLESVTDNASRATLYSYENGRLRSKTDPLNKVSVFGYSPAGAFQSSTDNATGAEAWVEHYPEQNKAVVHQRNGGTKTVEYDPVLDQPVRVTQADDNVVVYGYDNTTGKLTSISGPGQYSMSRRYEGNTMYETDALDRESTYVYNDFDQLVSFTDPESRTTEYHYDERGILDWWENAEGEMTVFEVDQDPMGRVTAITDPLGRRASIDYDGFGYPHTFTDNTGLPTDFVYDNVGNLRSVTDPSGIFTEFFYDNVNRLRKIVYNDNSYEQIDYVDNVVTHRDANGRVTTVEYTSWNQPYLLTDATDNVTRYEYTYGGCASCGPSGGLLPDTITNANGHEFGFRYDLMDRLERTIDPFDRGTVAWYHPEGTVERRIDANTHETGYGYDPSGRPTSITDALQRVMAFEYTPSGLLDNVIDANGNKTRYAYDNVGRVTGVYSPDAGTTTYDYYGDGTLRTRTDARGIVATFLYDNSVRLTDVTFPDPAEDRSYSYDSPASTFGRGRLTGMIDPSGSTTYQYDLRGRLKTEEKTVGQSSYGTGYGYDNVGNLTLLTYPSGRVVEYGYNAVDRPNQVKSTRLGTTKTLASTFGYDNVHNLKSVTLGNGIVEERSYDAAERLASISSPPGLALTFGYDNVGNIASIADNLSVPISPSLALTDYAYQSNRLDNVTEGGVTRIYAYDNTGSTIWDGALEYVYNQEGRLSKVKSGPTTIAEYVYDGKGRRVKKIAGGQTRLFQYDRYDRLISETDGSGNWLVDYVYLEDRPLAQIRPDGTGGERICYYHTDQLGTPKAMTDESQAVVWRMQFDAFGKEIPGGMKTVENNLRFAGQYFDAETGLHYNYFRNYDPTLGRYRESDPIGLAGGMNPYGYVSNSPLTYVDPYGLEKLILLKPYDPNYASAVAAPDYPGWLVIYAHGHQDEIYVEGKWLKSLDFAKYISKSVMWKPKMPIRIDACRTAEGENNIVRDTSVTLDTLVDGPDTRTLAWGRWSFGPWKSINIPWTQRAIPYYQGNWKGYYRGERLW